MTAGRDCVYFFSFFCFLGNVVYGVVFRLSAQDSTGAASTSPLVLHSAGSFGLPSSGACRVSLAAHGQDTPMAVLLDTSSADFARASCGSLCPACRTLLPSTSWPLRLGQADRTAAPGRQPADPHRRHGQTTLLATSRPTGAGRVVRAATATPATTGTAAMSHLYCVCRTDVRSLVY